MSYKIISGVMISTSNTFVTESVYGSDLRSCWNLDICGWMCCVLSRCLMKLGVSECVDMLLKEYQMFNLPNIVIKSPNLTNFLLESTIWLSLRPPCCSHLTLRSLYKNVTGINLFVSCGLRLTLIDTCEIAYPRRSCNLPNFLLWCLHP